MQRDYRLDIIRIIACLMVVLMHSPSSNGGLSGVACVGISMLTEPGIGLFFMVSGALLLPVKLSYKDFLMRRLSKVIWPTLFFTLFYLVVSFLYGEITLQELGRRILSVPFSPQGHGILWFMYTMIGMYIMAPIISPFLEKASKGEVQFVLLLWLITMCWPLIELALDVRKDSTSMLHLFCGYGGYFLLGYYLRKYPIRLKAYHFPILIAIPFGTCLFTKLKGVELDFYSIFWYLSIFCVMMCVAWYQLVIQYIKSDNIIPKIKTILVNFSNNSFGIYLIHIFFITRVIHPYSSLFSNAIINLLFNYVIVVVVSWLLSELISRTSCGKYIIGYNHK